jgi:hypothetical protein
VREREREKERKREVLKINPLEDLKEENERHRV